MSKETKPAPALVIDLFEALKKSLEQATKEQPKKPEQDKS